MRACPKPSVLFYFLALPPNDTNQALQQHFAGHKNPLSTRFPKNFARRCHLDSPKVTLHQYQFDNLRRDFFKKPFKASIMAAACHTQFNAQ